MTRKSIMTALSCFALVIGRGGPWRSSIWATGATECGSGFQTFQRHRRSAAGVRSYRRRGQNFIEASHRRRDGNRGQGLRQRHLDDDLGQRRIFSIPNVAPGEYLVTSQADGYPDTTVSQVTNHGRPGRPERMSLWPPTSLLSQQSSRRIRSTNTTGRAARQGEAEPVGRAW